MLEEDRLLSLLEQSRILQKEECKYHIDKDDNNLLYDHECCSIELANIEW